jgi:hypothetical protein
VRWREKKGFTTEFAEAGRKEREMRREGCRLRVVVVAIAVTAAAEILRFAQDDNVSSA